MARLFLIVIFVVICLVMAGIVYSASRSIVQSGQRELRGGTDMATTGIQKAAYIALIVVLFGTASGWLGGL